MSTQSLVFGAVQNLASSGAHADTTAFTSAHSVMVTTTAAVYVKVGPSAIATASDVILPPNVIVFLSVSSGDRISVLQVSAAGNVGVTDIKIGAVI